MNKDTHIGRNSSSSSRSGSLGAIHETKKKADEEAGTLKSSSSEHASQNVEGSEPEASSHESSGSQVSSSSHKLITPVVTPTTAQQQPIQHKTVAGPVTQVPLLSTPVTTVPAQLVAVNDAHCCTSAVRYTVVGGVVMSVLSAGIAVFAAYSDRADDLEDQALKAHMGLSAGLSALGGGLFGAAFGRAYHYIHHKLM